VTHAMLNNGSNKRSSCTCEGSALIEETRCRVSYPSAYYASVSLWTRVRPHCRASMAAYVVPLRFRTTFSCPLPVLQL
jgi:hypothetical protein